MARTIASVWDRTVGQVQRPVVRPCRARKRDQTLAHWYSSVPNPQPQRVELKWIVDVRRPVLQRQRDLVVAQVEMLAEPSHVKGHGEMAALSVPVPRVLVACIEAAFLERHGCAVDSKLEILLAGDLDEVQDQRQRAWRTASPTGNLTLRACPTAISAGSW